MNKNQKLVQQQFLNNEEAVIKRLKSVYKQSLKDIEGKAQELQNQINALDAMEGMTSDPAELIKLQSMKQSKVYQKQYQDALKKQISGILDNMHVEEFKTVSEYLNKCYEDGFIGTMFDLHGQGIPLCFPLDQESMVRAVQLDSKISQGLYMRLGEDIPLLKKKITAQVSRGISTGMSFEQVAKQLAGYTNIGYNNAIRIARTEGHRIQVQAGMDACYKAKEMGADVVKQWDSTLDSNTRESHAIVDGEIRELDEKFSNGLMFPGDPSGGAAEVCNCRCALLQRARWALDESELETLEKRAEYFGLDKSESFEDFKSKYLKSTVEISVGVPKSAKLFAPAKTIEQAEEYIKKFVDSNQFGAVGVSYKGIGVDSANAINEAITKLFESYDIGKLGGVIAPKGNTKLGKLIENAKAAYSPVRKSLMLNTKTFKNLKTVAKDIAEEKKLVLEYLKNPSSFTFRTKRAEAVMKASVVSGRATVPETVEDIINHEFGHTFEKAISQMDNYGLIKSNMSKYAEYISGYATSDMSEYIAESFASYMKGEKLIDPELKKAFNALKKKDLKKITVLSEKSSKNLENIGNSGIILSDKQFGKKVGRHAKDFGLSPEKAEDREKLRNIIADIINNKDDYAIGNWRGQSGQVEFFIKGEDVVIVKNNKFVSILKGGVNNARVKEARK